jgi:hypothetical protein
LYHVSPKKENSPKKEGAYPKREMDTERLGVGACRSSFLESGAGGSRHRSMGWALVLRRSWWAIIDVGVWWALLLGGGPRWLVVPSPPVVVIRRMWSRTGEYSLMGNKIQYNEERHLSFLIRLPRRCP